MTKTDLVDEEWLELVIEDVNEFTRRTFLEVKTGSAGINGA